MRTTAVLQGTELGQIMSTKVENHHRQQKPGLETQSVEQINRIVASKKADNLERCAGRKLFWQKNNSECRRYYTSLNAMVLVPRWCSKFSSSQVEVWANKSLFSRPEQQSRTYRKHYLRITLANQVGRPLRVLGAVQKAIASILGGKSLPAPGRRSSDVPVSKSSAPDANSTHRQPKTKQQNRTPSGRQYLWLLTIRTHYRIILGSQIRNIRHDNNLLVFAIAHASQRFR